MSERKGEIWLIVIPIIVVWIVLCFDIFMQGRVNRELERRIVILEQGR